MRGDRAPTLTPFPSVVVGRELPASDVARNFKNNETAERVLQRIYWVLFHCIFNNVAVVWLGLMYQRTVDPMTILKGQSYHLYGFLD